MSGTGRGRPRTTQRTRALGFSLPEILVALLLGLLVVHLGLDSLTRLNAARERIAARTDALVALRVGRHVLRREMRHGLMGTDWEVGGDSISIRAFRGAALVCRNDSTDARLVVSYAGDRAPDPTKDSVLLLTAEGRGEVRALEATAPPPVPCVGLDTAGAASFHLDDGAPRGIVALKLFERGSYHLSDAALRYRRGASGRQPLTPEVWSAATGWMASEAWVGVELFPLDSQAGEPWRGLLSWSGFP
jgi:hypothetical protein